MNSAFSDTIGQLLGSELTRTDGFPPADLVVSDENTARSSELLAKVLEEIRPTNPDYVTYFDVSKERYVFFLNTILQRPPGRFLDMGCSPGHLAMALSLAGYDVWGIDLNTEYLKKYPSAEWVDRLHLEQVAFEHHPLPHADESFDYVMLAEVLEHIGITDPVKILLEIKRVLKPGGVLFLSTPNVCNISHIVALLRGYNVFWSPEIFYGSLDRHNREYTPAELLNLVKNAHFQTCRLAYINSPHSWNDKTADYTYELLGKLWNNLAEVRTDPRFKNTLFIEATK